MPTATFTDKDLLKSIQTLTGHDTTDMIVYKKTINEKKELEVIYKKKKQELVMKIGRNL